MFSHFFFFLNFRFVSRGFLYFLDFKGVLKKIDFKVFFIQLLF
jgi:hypothetical protein